VYLALYLVYIVYFISSENVFVANYVFVGTDDKALISVELFKCDLHIAGHEIMQ